MSCNYDVVLLDCDGFEICCVHEDRLSTAKARGKYMLSPIYARVLETTHEALGTRCVEVRSRDNGIVVWDQYLRVGVAA